mmetsp:Transcript_26552/g.61800  ORF Transcript_26552/g.61800 Transcript_26552/m.61800 type:complete len:577 (-) Transcript_26552:224-1954(-)
MNRTPLPVHRPLLEEVSELDLMTEFVLGATVDSDAELPDGRRKTLTPNSRLDSFILFTEVYHEITVTLEYVDVLDDEDLMVVEFFSFPGSGFSIGLHPGEENPTESIDLGPKAPFLQRIVMQQFVRQAPDAKDLHWLSIGYLRLEAYNGQVLEVGRRMPTGAEYHTSSEGVKIFVLEAKEVLGPCMISGMGQHKMEAFCMQVIKLPPQADPLDMLEFCIHGRAKAGLHRAEDAEKMTEQFVCVEAMEVQNLVFQLWDRLYFWTGTRGAVDQMKPFFFDFIRRAVALNESEISMAVQRAQRQLAYRVQKNLWAVPDIWIEWMEGREYPDPFAGVKMVRIFAAFAKTMASCQTVLLSKCQVNCYMVAFLEPESRFNKCVAICTMICQIGLILQLASGLDLHHRGLSEYFILSESVVLAPILTIFGAMLVYKQASNSWDFRRAFPGFSTSPWGLMDILANMVSSVMAIALNFILLVTAETQVDFVLNSVAAFFIVELDDQAVFIDGEAASDLYRSQMINILDQNLREVDERFFEWRLADEARQKGFLVDTGRCTIFKAEPSACGTLLDAHSRPSMKGVA